MATKKISAQRRAKPGVAAVATGSGISRVLALSFSLARLVDRCAGKRDRECLYRLFKEASIIDQDFESACALRTLQFENKPTRFPNIRDVARPAAKKNQSP